MADNITAEGVNATENPFVFVALYKNTFERGGRKLISYKPGYLPKGETDKSKVKTFPIGLGEFTSVPDGDYMRDEYTHKFWCSVAVNEDDRGDLVVVLSDTENQADRTYVFLVKSVKDGKTSYSTSKPVEIASKKYWVNLTKNTREDKTQDLNLTFREAGEGTGGEAFGSDKEISFDDSFDI